MCGCGVFENALVSGFVCESCFFLDFCFFFLGLKSVQVLSQLYPGLASHAELLVRARDTVAQKAELRSALLQRSSARDVKKWFHRIFALHPVRRRVCLPFMFVRGCVVVVLWRVCVCESSYVH